jgi:hypothetical protein
VYSEQEDDCHGDSRGGDYRGGHCATAVPSLRHQAGPFGLRPFWGYLEQTHHRDITNMTVIPAFILPLAALLPPFGAAFALRPLRVARDLEW